MLLQMRHHRIAPRRGRRRNGGSSSTADTGSKGRAGTGAFILSHNGARQFLQTIFERRLVFIDFKGGCGSIQAFLEFPRLARQLPQPNIGRLRPLASPQQLCTVVYSMEVIWVKKNSQFTF